MPVHVEIDEDLRHSGEALVVETSGVQNPTVGPARPAAT